MVSFLESRCGNQDLATLVEPAANSAPTICAPATPASRFLLSDVDELSEVVADSNPTAKAFPSWFASI